MKNNKLEISSPESRSKNIRGIIVALLSIALTIIGGYEYVSYRDRPIISVNVLKITLYYHDNNWQSDLDYEIINSGKREQRINSLNLRIRFPQIDNRFIEQEIKLDSVISGNHQMKARAHPSFSMLNKYIHLEDSLHKLSEFAMEMDLKDPGGITANRSFSSMNCDILFSESAKNLSTSSYGQISWIDNVPYMNGEKFAEFAIDFEGNLYRNFVFPRNTKVNYHVNESREIKLGFTYDVGETPIMSSTGQKISFQIERKVPIFYFDTRIENRVRIPQEFTLKYDEEHRGKESIQTLNRSIKIPNCYSCIIYNFK